MGIVAGGTANADGHTVFGMRATPPDKIAQLQKWLRDGTAVRLRTEAEQSRCTIAYQLGVAETTVYRWETGRRSPRGASALAYHRILARLAARSAS